MDERPEIKDGALIGYSGDSIMRTRMTKEEEAKLREGLIADIDFSNIPELPPQ